MSNKHVGNREIGNIFTPRNVKMHKNEVEVSFFKIDVFMISFLFGPKRKMICS